MTDVPVEALQCLLGATWYPGRLGSKLQSLGPALRASTKL
jgi:hypothetical protein